jgi:hypothetical protein
MKPNLKLPLSICLIFMVSGVNILNAQNLQPQKPSESRISRGFGAHDPVMIKQDGTYYLFTTGMGVSVASSTDMVNWKREKPVFDQAPEWVTQEIVPGWKENGKLLSRGGGTLIAQGNDDWAGVGHSGTYTFNGKSYLICHGYDKHDNGRSKLIIREIK